MFNIGLLNESDWQGQWIGMDHANAWDKEVEHSQLSARYLRTEFETGKEPIRQATLYVSGLGMYEAFINGQKVGDDVLAPAPTDYRKTVLYNAYDVTSLLSPDGEDGMPFRCARQRPLLHHAAEEEALQDSQLRIS